MILLVVKRKVVGGFQARESPRKSTEWIWLHSFMRGKMMRRENGFSLLEAMVISGVVLVVSAIAAPSIINTSRQYQLKATARQIDQVLQAAKYDAIRENLSKSVTFNLSTNRLTMSNGQVIQLPSGVTFSSLESSETAPAIIVAGAAAPLASQQPNSKVSCSFPVGSNTYERTATFTSRGLPNVEPGAFNWVYLKNIKGELAAVTLSSAGSTATFDKMYRSEWKGSSSGSSSYSSGS